MWRGDAARSGYTAQAIPPRLSLRWKIEEQHAPMPAWPTSGRLTYDRAYPVVVADRWLYYATSSDNKVVAVDAASGKHRWTYVTDAPVRFAPAAWRDRIFVAGDDGFLYCLAAADGRVCWKRRGGPRADMLLGNDRMISRWPVRGGPVVVDDIVYFGAGIWPSEGIFLYALDAATGKLVWANDSAGAMEMDQPHPGAKAKSGASAQGCLAVAGDALLVPTGRAVPAVFDRTDGKLRYFHLQANRAEGGSAIAAIDQNFFNGGTMFEIADGRLAQALGSKVGKKGDPVTHSYVAGIQVAAHPKWIVYSTENHIKAVDRRAFLVDKASVGRKGEKTKTKTVTRAAWDVELPVRSLASLIVAGDCVIAGAKDAVLMLDVASGQTLWQAQVKGTAHDLAAADGRLYASTDRGWIYCFDGGQGKPTEIRKSQPLPDAGDHAPYAAAAEEIIRRSGVREGYCLDLACGDGRLALELARRTKLHIYAVEADPEKVQAARRLLDAAGLYGVRVTVLYADPGAAPCPNYFADLIVSGRSITEGSKIVPQKPMTRMQRPYGGIACLGRPGAMQMSSRGPLAGAGDWSHQYANAANTLCSDDTHPRSPLAMLWFRDTDLVMPSRHGRGPAPLVAEGRMFTEGLNAIRAVNIYNGSTLWEVRAPGILAAYHQDHLGGVAVTGSNMCLGDDRLFFHNGSTCAALDTKTGRKLTSWDAPPQADGKPGTWGYLAYWQGTLFGSLANEEHKVKESWNTFQGKLDMSGLLSESTALLALDARTGRLKWKFAAEHSIRHNAIAIGQGRVYLIDRPLTLGDTPRGAAKAVEPKNPPGRLLCLDAESGKRLWKAEDVFGSLLALSQPHDVLLMAQQSTRFKLASELGGRMAGFRASDGARLWEIAAETKSRPLLVDRAIYAEPGKVESKPGEQVLPSGKWDLLSGDPLPFKFSRSYGCGILAGSRRLLVFRSATLGYFDLEGSRQTENYGGVRPGCWVNAIPAGGLVLLADAASWCTCSYLNQATMALEPKP